MSTDLAQHVGKVSLWAIASLVCGVVGLITGVVAIPAVVFGHIAKREIARNSALSGSGMATAGLVLGYIGIAIMLIGLLLFGGLGMFVRALMMTATW